MSERAVGQIHDLGYKRYVGTRRPPSTRWRAIARHQISGGWKGWWRYKLPLAITVIITVICAVFVFVVGTKTVGVTGLSFADLALSVSISWSCRAAFIFSITVGATVIAGDMQSGAFTFYFARSTRPIDYLAGKLAGLGVLVGGLVFVFPVIVGCLRLALVSSTGSSSAVVDSLALVPEMMIVGALATLVYTAVPLGFSALVGNKRYAQGLWAAYYMIGGTIAAGIGLATHSWIGALDLSTAILAVADSMIHLGRGAGMDNIPLTAALISIGVHVGLSIAIIWFQLTNAQKSGVGGAT